MKQPKCKKNLWNLCQKLVIVQKVQNKFIKQCKILSPMNKQSVFYNIVDYFQKYVNV
jgi:hypothetical protein